MIDFEREARKHIASRGSAETRRHYERFLERWLAFCSERGFSADEPDLAAATAFRDALPTMVAGGSASDSTVRFALSALSSMYEAAGVVNPFKSSRRLARPPADDVGVTQALTQEEVDALFKAVDDDLPNFPIHTRDRAIMWLLYETGARVSTIVAMERDALHVREQDGEQVLVLVAKVKKRGRVEIVIPDRAREWLSRWMSCASSGSKWVFSGLGGRRHVTRQAVSQRLAHYGKLAGVSGAAPHRLRATYITEALDAGIPLHEVQASVHHADPKTTQRYDRGKRGGQVAGQLSKFRQEKKS